MKDVAVILNTADRPFLLKDLVEVLKGQLRSHDSLIIVNDGEPGSVQRFAEDRVFTIDHCKPYYALASGRNKGMKAAISLGYDWGVFIDDDVVVSEDWLEVHRKGWQEKETVYAGKILEPRNSEYDIRALAAGKEEELDQGEVPEKLLIMLGGCNFGCHLPSLSKVGGFNEDFDGNYGLEDVELAYRLIKIEGWNVQYLKDAAITNIKAPPSGSYTDRKIGGNKERIKEIVPTELIWWHDFEEE